MRHSLITAITAALAWDDPAGPSRFRRGRLDDIHLPEKMMSADRLLATVQTTNPGPAFLQLWGPDGAEPHDRFYHEMDGRTIPDLEAIGRILNSGGSLRYRGLQNTSSAVEVAARALSWATGGNVHVNAYLAAGETKAFGVHLDFHDVVVVQVSGAKKWEVRGVSRPFPRRDDGQPRGQLPDEVLWSGVLRAGDVMLVPHGYWHEATRVGETEQDHSLHLTFGIRRPAALNWVASLRRRAGARVDYRAHLLDAAQPGRDEALIRELTALAGEYPPARYLIDYRHEAAASRHAPFVPAFGPLRIVAAVTPFPPEVARVGDSLVVSGGGRELSFPRNPETEHVISLLLSGNPVDIAYDGTDENVKKRAAVARTVAETLVHEGLCAALGRETGYGYYGFVPVITLAEPPPAD